MTIFTFHDETLLERHMIKELLEVREELTLWEQRFLHSMSKWSGNFTWNQARTIVIIHCKHFPQQYKEPMDSNHPPL